MRGSICLSNEFIRIIATYGWRIIVCTDSRGPKQTMDGRCKHLHWFRLADPVCRENVVTFRPWTKIIIINLPLKSTINVSFNM